MSYILTGKIGNHTYKRDLGGRYTEAYLNAEKRSIRTIHKKQWGSDTKGLRFAFTVVFK